MKVKMALGVGGCAAQPNPPNVPWEEGFHEMLASIQVDMVVRHVRFM
jgi:hypothetical protein